MDLRPLRPSLFERVPPFINFVPGNELIIFFRHAFYRYILALVYKSLFYCVRPTLKKLYECD